MLSRYRFMGTTEGRKNGLLQMKRLCRLLKAQEIPYTMTEKQMPAKTLGELDRLKYNVHDWWGRSYLNREHPSTYFEVVFKCNEPRDTTTAE